MAEEVFDTFGEALKSIMRKRGRKQSWIVDKTGKDKKQISNYVTGKTEPYDTTLNEISVSLGVQIEESDGKYVLVDPFDSEHSHSANMKILHQSILNDAESLVEKIRRLIEIEKSSVE